jgi:hypothetical protein
MHECKEWTRPQCYIGATWEGWHSAGFGRSRDSDALEESNFQVALAEFNKLIPDDTDSLTLEQLEGLCSITVVRESHWAVGWVEWIAIHSSNTAALELARELCERANDYPILNESHFSELECTQANEVWASCFNAKGRVEYIRQHRSQFEFRDLADLLGCVRGKYFAGYASELLG